MTTVKFGPEDMADGFTVGESVSIDDFTYEAACAVFGQPLVDQYLAWKLNPPEPPCGYVKVVSIDSEAGTVTFDTLPCARADGGSNE